MEVIGAPHKEYQVKLVGGGNMFPEKHNTMPSQVGSRNALAAQQLAKQHGFTCVAEHLGDVGHRNVIFEVWSGEVWVKHVNVLSITEHNPIDRRLK
jgi:chemotaxis protein CheD